MKAPLVSVVCQSCQQEFFRQRYSKATYCSHRCVGLAISARRWTQTPEQRYWSKIEQGAPDDCWPWKGTRGKQGYGSIYWDGKCGQKAHRVGWELAFGPIPEGLGVLHTCDNPPCQNPAHFFLGTRADNNADKVKKGRGARGDKIRRTSMTKLDWNKVNEIRRLYDTGEYTQRQLARQFGVTQARIQQIVNFMVWKPDDFKGYVRPVRKPDRSGEKSPKALLTNEQARSIREQYQAGKSYEDLASEFGVSPQIIGGIVRGRYYPDPAYPPLPLRQQVHLTDEQAETIRKRYAAGGVTHRALAREYGVCHGTIGSIIRKGDP